MDAEWHLQHEGSGVSEEGSFGIERSIVKERKISHITNLETDRKKHGLLSEIHRSIKPESTLVLVGVLLSIALFMYHFVNNCMTVALGENNKLDSL